MSPSTTRDTAVKWTAYALACLLLLFGHELTLAHLRVWGIAPFLPPLLPAVLASMEDRLEGFVFALAFGVLCDLALTARCRACTRSRSRSRRCSRRSSRGACCSRASCARWR